MVEVALKAARAGCQVLCERGLPRPGTLAGVGAKGAGDYVTEADLASEAAIVEVLERETPGIGIQAEERGGSGSATRWAVDPLDGTTNFIRGFPAVGVSVGLIDGNWPVAGVVIAPFLDLEYAGEHGQGVRLNGEPLPPLGGGNPGLAVLATGFPFRNKARLPRYLQVLSAVVDRFEDLRRPGTASLDLAWTAARQFDGFFELGLGTWDMAAGAALILELGGLVTDWSGGNNWLATGDVLAAPPTIHEILLELASNPAISFPPPSWGREGGGE